MIEAVLFDVDGTLIDSNYWHVTAWQQAFVKIGHPQPGWRVHAAMGMGGDRLVAEVAGDAVEAELGDDARAAWKDSYDLMIDQVRPFDGAADLIREVHASGRVVVLASSANPDHLAVARKLLDVDDVLEGVLSGEDVDSSKPSSDLFDAALDKIGRRPAIVVGDTRWDVESARAAGLDTVALLCGGRSAEELRRAGAVAVYRDPADALQRSRDGTSPLFTWQGS